MRVRETLAAIYADAALYDSGEIARATEALDREKQLPSDSELCYLFARARQPVSDRLGNLIYVLVRSSNSRCVFEFGTSHGAGTICLAAAVRDNGGGCVVTTEFDVEKIALAEANLGKAGLREFVEFRHGDALQTVKQENRSFDFVFLDGWQHRYSAILTLIEPKLMRGSLIVADDIFPELIPDYMSQVAGPEYTSVALDVGSKVVLSFRVGEAT